MFDYQSPGPRLKLSTILKMFLLVTSTPRQMLEMFLLFSEPGDICPVRLWHKTHDTALHKKVRKYSILWYLYTLAKVLLRLWSGFLKCSRILYFMLEHFTCFLINIFFIFPHYLIPQKTTCGKRYHFGIVKGDTCLCTSSIFL